MAVVTSDLVFLTQAGIKTEFNNAYIQALENAAWKDVATEIPTVLPIQKYGWLGRGAVMKPYVDESDAQSIAEHDYTVADIIYKGKLDVQRKALEDEQYGLLMMRARDLGREPIRHWNQLAFLGLAAGFTTTCYDGQYFFDTDHSEGDSGTQVNKTSNSLSDSSLEAADAAMRDYVDDKGVPLEIVPDTLVVGPALARRAWDLTQSQVVVHNAGDGTAGSGATAYTNFSNYFGGRYRVIVNPYLRNGTFWMADSAGQPIQVTYTAKYNWFLLDTSREIKPIVIQNREDVPITLETDMDQPTAKIKELYQFTARGRYAQAYGLWQTAYGSNATN